MKTRSRTQTQAQSITKIRLRNRLNQDVPTTQMHDIVLWLRPGHLCTAYIYTMVWNWRYFRAIVNQGRCQNVNQGYYEIVHQGRYQIVNQGRSVI